MPYIHQIEANGTLYDIQQTDEEYFYRVPNKNITTQILFPETQLAQGVKIHNRHRAFYERLSTSVLQIWLDITVENAQTNPWLDQVSQYDLYTSANRLTAPNHGVIWHPESEFAGTADKNLIDCWFSGREQGENYVGTIHIDPRKIKPKITGTTLDFQFRFNILWFGVFYDYIALFEHSGDDFV